MPFENANTLAELNPLWPLGSDSLGAGDDHIRQLKKVLQVPKVVFQNLTEALNSDDTLTVYEGAAHSIKDGVESEIWDVVLTSAVTPDGDDVAVSIEFPLLSFVKRDVKATITFTFDGAYASFISTVVPMFTNRGITCGTSIITKLMETPGTRYSTSGDLLQAEKDGFEMLNRNLTAEPLIDTSAGTEFAKSQINGAFDLNTRYGFNIMGYVAGNSFLDPSYLDIVKEKHANAYVVNKGSLFGQAALQNKPLDLYNLHRTNLNSVGLANAKATVDAAIASKGLVIFYGHDPLNEAGNPASMPTEDVEELLDYILAKPAGTVQILNPTEGLGQLGRASYRQNQESINNSNREQTSIGYQQNLLRDPWFKTLNEGFSGWAPTNGSGDAGFVAAKRKRGSFGNSAIISVFAGGTVADGTYIFASQAQRREAFTVQNLTNLTFSAKIYITSLPVDDNFEITMGITQFKTSDDSPMASVESEQITMDTVARLASVTLQPVDLEVESYVQVFWRVTEKVIGVGGSIIVADPMLNYGDKAAPYSDSSSIDIKDWDSANALLDMLVTNIPIGVFTLFDIETVNKAFWKMTNGVLLIRDTGFYAWNLQNVSDTVASFTDERALTEMFVDDVAEGKRNAEIQSGTKMYFRHSGVAFFESGTELDWRGFHGIAGGFNTGNNDNSFFRFCKIG